MPMKTNPTSACLTTGFLSFSTPAPGESAAQCYASVSRQFFMVEVADGGILSMRLNADG